MLWILSSWVMGIQTQALLEWQGALPLSHLPLESPSNSMPERSLLTVGRYAGQLGSGVIKQGVWAIGGHCTSVVERGHDGPSLGASHPGYPSD